MEGTETTQAPEATTATAPAVTSTPEPSKSGIVITRKGGQDVTPQTTATPPVAAATTTPPATEPPATPPANSEGPTGDSGGTGNPGVEQTTPPAPQEEEIEFFPYAAQVTDGTIKSADDVLNLYKEHTELKKKFAEKPKIEFPNPEAEAAYNIAIKFPGREQAAVNGFYHVLGLGDVSKLSDKEAQFEHFALEHKDFSRSEAREYFEAKYEKTFGNGALEEDKVAQYDHRIQTQKAREALKKLQDEVDNYKPSQPAGSSQQPVVSEAEMAAVKAKAQEALSDFGGMSYQYFDNDPNSVVNIPMEDSEVQQLESWMSSPKEFLDAIGEMAKENGEVSYKKLRQIMFEIKNLDRIKSQHFVAGTKYGELKIIKERKNTATPPATPPATATPAPAADFKGAFRDAVKKPAKV